MLKNIYFIFKEVESDEIIKIYVIGCEDAVTLRKSDKVIIEGGFLQIERENGNIIIIPEDKITCVKKSHYWG